MKTCYNMKYARKLFVWATSTQRAGRGKNGSAFVIVMILTGVLMIAGLSITFLTSNASFTSRKLHTGARALAIAEAGIADQCMKMSTNGGSAYNYWASGVTNSGSIDGGTYVVIASLPANSPNIIITSVGTVEGESRTTVVELKRLPSINGALVAGGDIHFKSAAAEINGDVFANGDVLKDVLANPTVNGDISAHGGTITVDGTGVENPTAPEASTDDIMATMSNEVPFAIVYSDKFAAYSNAAAFADRFAGPKTWNGEAINPVNGIVFVSGDAFVTRRSSLKGIIVATGSISIDNQFLGASQFNTNWTVSLISGWNVTCQNLNTFNGMIFAGNDITMENNRQINGKLVALNNITIDNRGVVTPPTNTAAGFPAVDIAGWLR